MSLPEGQPLVSYTSERARYAPEHARAPERPSGLRSSSAKQPELRSGLRKRSPFRCAIHPVRESARRAASGTTPERPSGLASAPRNIGEETWLRLRRLALRARQSSLHEKSHMRDSPRSIKPDHFKAGALGPRHLN